jgi:hypothetical protein
METVGAIISIFEKQAAIRAVSEFSHIIIPAKGKNILFSRPAPGAQSASYPMFAGNVFPRGKAAEAPI